MATNRVQQDGQHITVACTDPAVPASGDPCRLGTLTGIALTTESQGGNPTGNTSIDTAPSVWNLSVKGVDGGGNSAVAAGDSLYYVDADTPKLSKKATGVFFGWALDPITSGATATIRVRHAAQ